MSSSEDDSTPRERLEASIRSPYDPNGPVASGLLSALAAEFEELETVLNNVLAAKFVAEAEGAQLDRLATIFQDVERKTGESDAKYRLRLQTALRAQLSSGRISDIKGAVAVLLGGSTSDVVIEEPSLPDEPLVDVGIWEEQLDDQGLSVDEFFDEVDPLTASGVSVEGFVRGNFRFTDELEPVTSDSGFSGLQIGSTGGTWPTLDEDGTFVFTDESDPVESDEGFAALEPDGEGGTWPELLQ